MNGYAIIRLVHAISSCARNIEGPYPVTGSDLRSAEDAKSWIRKHTSATHVPLKEARQTECGGWVFFPLRKRGSVYWSVSLRLDVEAVQEEAANCSCRNCRYRDR